VGYGEAKDLAGGLKGTPWRIRPSRINLKKNLKKKLQGL
jgi:hypothetical protein